MGKVYIHFRGISLAELRRKVTAFKELYGHAPIVKVRGRGIDTRDGDDIWGEVEVLEIRNRWIDVYCDGHIVEADGTSPQINQFTLESRS